MEISGLWQRCLRKRFFYVGNAVRQRGGSQWKMAKNKEAMGLPKYKSKEDLEEQIQSYFRQCEGEVLRDDYGTVVCQKNGEPIRVGEKPPTVAGLAFALGFFSKEGFLHYEGKYRDTVARARLCLEGRIEEQLYNKDGLHGAKFTLINNFEGWADKTKEEGELLVFEKLDGILEGINNAAKR